MSGQFQSVIFDLDGTLWDASEATAAGWTRVAKEFDLKTVITADQVRAVSGLPFDECVTQRFGSRAALIPGLRERLEHEERVSVAQGHWKLYDGVREALERISVRKPVSLVSNCQQWYLDIFLRDSGLGTYFREALSHGGTGFPKTQMIRSLVDRPRQKPALYVGDTHWDQASAYRAGASFAFVEWGFGRIEVSSPRFSNFENLVEFATRDGIPPVEVVKLERDRYDEAIEFYRRVGYAQEIDPESLFVVARCDGRLVGVVRLEHQSEVQVLRGMQVEPTFQAAGTGLRMIRLLETYIDSDCYCIPHDWLAGFYGKMGFVLVDANAAPGFLAERLTRGLEKYPQLVLMKRSKTRP